MVLSLSETLALYPSFYDLTACFMAADAFATCAK